MRTSKEPIPLAAGGRGRRELPGRCGRAAQVGSLGQLAGVVATCGWRQHYIPHLETLPDLRFPAWSERQWPCWHCLPMAGRGRGCEGAGYWTPTPSALGSEVRCGVLRPWQAGSLGVLGRQPGRQCPQVKQAAPPRSITQPRRSHSTCFAEPREGHAFMEPDGAL